VRAGRSPDERAGQHSRAAPRRHRVRVHLGRDLRLSLVDPESADEGRARTGRRQPPCKWRTSGVNFGNMTAAHFIFIPAVLLIGMVIGWILGSRAAADAYAAEARRREERAARNKT